MRKKIYKTVNVIFCILFCYLCLFNKVTAKEENVEISSISISDGEHEYGSLYGAPYSDSDDSQWLTLKLGERGLRIVNDTNDDIILVDKFGSVYINGQLCKSTSTEVDSEFYNEFSFGFMYFLIIISLLIGGYNLLTKKRN